MEFYMKVEVDGKEVQTTETGFLVNLEDWNENIAKVIDNIYGTIINAGTYKVDSIKISIPVIPFNE